MIQWIIMSMDYEPHVANHVATLFDVVVGCGFEITRASENEKSGRWRSEKSIVTNKMSKQKSRRQAPSIHCYNGKCTSDAAQRVQYWDSAWKMAKKSQQMVLMCENVHIAFWDTLCTFAANQWNNCTTLRWTKQIDRYRSRSLVQLNWRS